MKSIKFIILFAAIFFIGFYCGTNLQKVDATVKAPDEHNQPTESTGSENPHRNPEKAPEVDGSKKIIIPQPAKPQPVGNKDEKNPATTVKDTVQNKDKRPLPTAAATDNGVTLYSLSSSMLVDIERMEEDLATLKNKVIILNNMR